MDVSDELIVYNFLISEFIKNSSLTLLKTWDKKLDYNDFLALSVNSLLFPFLFYFPILE